MDEVDLVSIAEVAATGSCEPSQSGPPRIRQTPRRKRAPQPTRSRDAARSDHVTPLDRRPDGALLRTLLIEDQHTVALSLKRQLEAEEIRVDVAADGETGLAMARRRAYDAILLDRRLPKMSGDQVLAKLREDGDRTPVLILTGYPDVESAFHAGRLHAAEYLQKGTLTAAQLAAAVRGAAATNPRATLDGALFATPVVGTSPRVREVRSCLQRIDAQSMRGTDLADAWRRTMATALVRTAGSRNVTFLEFAACAKALQFLYARVQASLDATERRIGDLLADLVRRNSFPPHPRALSIVSRIAAAGPKWPDLSEQQIAQEEYADVADTARWLDEYAGISFVECRRLVVTRQVALRLTETTDQVKRVAFTVGYKHESRLDRDFEATVGVAPTTFRTLYGPSPDVR